MAFINLGRIGLFITLVVLLCVSAKANICMRKVYSLPTQYGRHHVFMRHIPGTDRYILFQESGAARIIKENADQSTFNEEEEILLSFRLEGKLDSNGKVRSILFHPDFETNRRVFIYYMCDKNNPACVVANADDDCDLIVNSQKCCAPECLSADGYYGYLSEFLLTEQGTTWSVSSESTILRITFPDFYHAGGGMVFDAAGKLLLGVGDGSAQNDGRRFAQTESNIRGKMIRIDVDNTDGMRYAVPSDNPYVGNVEGYDERIWSSGLRQPFRCSYDQVDDHLLCGNVGETSVEAVYKIEKGVNHGWGRYEGTMLLNSDIGLGFRDSAGTVNYPVFEYCRGYKCDGLDMCFDGTCVQRGSAIIGGFIYRGSINPEFSGKYFCSDWHPEYPDIYVVEPSTAKKWSHFKLTWQQPNGQAPSIHPTYQLEPAANGDLLMLNADGIYRMVPNIECGITNGLAGGNETITQVEVDIPYVERSLNTPVEVSSGTSGSLAATLRVQQYSYSIPGVLSLTTRAYNGAVPGPTIRVRAGDELRIQLINELPANFDYKGENTWNTYNRAETTNLHLHGVHVSPQGKGDDVWVEVNPGETYEYVYEIPSDHAPGLNYYHAHYHGSTAVQVQGGLYGAFIVEEEASYQSAPLIALDEHILLINIVNLDPRNAENINSLAALAESSFRMEGTGEIDGLNYIILANGGFQPTITQTTDLVKLRLVNTAAYALFIGFGHASCSMHIIARDGIYLSEPHNSSDIFLGPGNRADILVSCSSTGLFPLKSKSTRDYAHIPVQTIVGDLLYLKVDSAPGNIKSLLDSIELPALPAYLDDLVSTSNPVYRAEDLVFSHGYQINGFQLGDREDVSEIWLVDTVQERKLTSVSFHPIHMHTNHFQIVDFEFSSPVVENREVLFRIGEWRDTIPVMDGLKVTVRFLTDKYTGIVPTHCQVASHQDQGMVRLAKIINEADLGDNGRMRIFTTVINDYTDPTKNQLGGVDSTEVSMLSAYNGALFLLRLQATAVGSFYYNTFDSGYSRRETGVYVTAGIQGELEFYSNYRQAGSNEFYRTPLQSMAGTSYRVLQNFYVPFSPVTNPLTFVPSAVNSFSIVVGSLATEQAIIDIHEIGFYRDLDLKRDNINVPPTRSPTSLTIPHNRSVVLFANETAYRSRYSDDNTMGVSLGSQVGRELFLQLDVTTKDTGYVYFNFDSRLLENQDGAYLIISPSDGMLLEVELRTISPKALKKSQVLGSSTKIKGNRGDGYEEHLIAFSASPYTSVVLKVIKADQAQFVRVKEVGLFSYKEKKSDPGMPLTTVLIIASVSLMGVALAVISAWAVVSSMTVGGEKVITRTPSYNKRIDVIQ